MTLQRYSIRESINRILRLFQGETPGENPDTLTGDVLSTNQGISNFAELIASSLPGESLALPQSFVDAIGNAGFISGADTIGGYYLSTSSGTVIAGINTPVKVAGSTTAYASNFQTDMPSDNRLRYTGATSKTFEVVVALSTTAAANNKDVTWYLYKNGEEVLGSAIQRKQGTGADVGAVSLVTLVSMGTNDYVEVWVAGNTDTTTITATKISLVMR